MGMPPQVRETHLWFHFHNKLPWSPSSSAKANSSFMEFCSS